MPPKSLFGRARVGALEFRALSLPQNCRASPQALSQHLATKGETRRVAVKVTDPRGNEGMRVLTVKD